MRLRQLPFLLLLISSRYAMCQSYDTKIEHAAGFLEKKDYPSALNAFKDAFKDTATSTPYDFYFGAIAAVGCNEIPQAFEWLNTAQRRGLGLKKSDIEGLKKDSSLAILHSYAQWDVLISSMERASDEKLAMDKKRMDDWLSSVRQNRVGQKEKGKYLPAGKGFALYYSQADTLKVPFLVYVPDSYTSTRPMQTIVFLHGGVESRANFNDKDPDIGREPIFSTGDSLNAIIIYPFAKKDFGWVNQQAAFEQVLLIIKEAELVYNIDRNRLFLAGMSNGGSASFWFASQHPNPFKGFLAISALPALKIGNIDFSHLSPEKPFYSVHAKDDEVFPYDSVRHTYDTEQGIAKGWHFETLPQGGHGFIYGPTGREILVHYLKKLMED